MGIKESLDDQSVALGEIENFVSHKITGALDASHETKASRLSKEAQANMAFVADKGYMPEMRRNFSILALLGVGFGLTNSWFGISASLVTSISSGGPMMIIYGIIIIGSISLCIAVSLSELASAMPNAGGQYYWTMKLAPPKYAPIASYLCGAFAWAGAIFTSASVTILIASTLVGMYVLNSNDLNASVSPWQVFLTYQVVNTFLLIFNIWERPLPIISLISLYISLASFVIITIVVLVKSSGHYQTVHFVFVEFSNGTGWSSAGIAFIVGLINPSWSFSCLDAATHLAEETMSPQTDVPKAIIGTVIIGLVTSLLYAIAMFFCIRNLDEILESTTGSPIIDIYHQALNSKSGATGLSCLILFTAIGCNIASHTWQARLCWSFSRDRGLPGSRYWSKINPHTGAPLNAHIMSCAWCAVIGCIYMGSTTAYHSLVIGCIFFLLLSYLLPVVFLLIKGRNNIVHGPFWMGKIGLVCNLVLIFWTIFTTIFYSFPAVMPVTAGNMNYVSAVIAVFFLYCIAYWYARGKSQYRTSEEREKEAARLVTRMSNQVDQFEMIVLKGNQKV